jgi:wobble nucleotide-excising tRNase
MIENITLQNITSYPKTTSVPIGINKKRVNLFYGLNGSGKSTVARYLQDIGSVDYSNCRITPIQNQNDIIVYNQNFVENNFYEKTSQQGIFTIGEADATAEKDVENTLLELEKVNTEIGDIAEQILTKETDQDKLTNSLKEVIWKKKKTFENHPLSFCIKDEKNVGKKDGFLRKILSIEGADNTTFEKLSNEAQELSGENIQELENVSTISFSSQYIEKETVFSEKIVGETDSYLSELIDKLGNSDWIRNGIDFLDESDCPFCQQPINDDIKSNIKSLFSTVYEEKISNLERLCSTYQQSVTTIQNTFNSPIFSMKHIAKYEKLETLKIAYIGKLHENITLLENKLSNPSAEIDLTDTNSQLKDINDYIETIQQEILAFNNKLAQKDKIISNITTEFWKTLKQDCQSAIDLDSTSQKEIENSLKSLQKKLQNAKYEKIKFEQNLSELRSRSTDIVTSVENVNRRLKSLGVIGFSLKASEEGSALYFIERANGTNTNVFRSLSEGEKTLITFLYFIEKCSGATSKEDNAICSNRTIVIDDPISSLSQNYVFDIASIIHHEIIKKNFKQIFVLTHNLYFFHELLMLKSSQQNHLPKDYNLFRVIKSDHTNVLPMKRNTLLNDYQNFWQIIKDCEEKNFHASMLPNAMRNILERYFSFIHQQGNLKKVLEDIGAVDKEFEPFLRYFNRGSHSDAINLDLGTIDTQRYISKFREIFVETGFPEHYDTMMEKEIT